MFFGGLLGGSGGWVLLVVAKFLGKQGWREGLLLMTVVLWHWWLDAGVCWVGYFGAVGRCMIGGWHVGIGKSRCQYAPQGARTLDLEVNSLTL